MSLDPVNNLPNPGPLTEAQRVLIKATVPLLEERGVDITSCFYKAMLGANPDLKNVFSNTKQVVRANTNMSLLMSNLRLLCFTERRTTRGLGSLRLWICCQH